MRPRWSAAEMIARLGLVPHPDGGHYREVLRSDTNLTPWGAGNTLSAQYTLTYFLLAQGEFAPFRRLSCDESWHLYRGGPAEVHQLTQRGDYRPFVLARDFGAGNEPQLRLERHTWVAIRPAPGVPWTLLVCVVPHGTDFAEFQVGTRNDLAMSYPGHTTLIDQFTKPL